MGARSAGLLLYRISGEGVAEVLIAHPGGPFWTKRDHGAWSVPKGEYDTGEDPRAAAHREFEEETGLAVPDGVEVCLGELRQPGGKLVTLWALEADLDVTNASSNTFELEWPRGSGQMRNYPEVDRVAWVTLRLARAKLLRGQVPFLDRMKEVLAARDVLFVDGPPPERGS
jgi:predicted NUDIX family NTP pyrophosphohydrolase